MNLSNTGLDLIKQFEGLRLTAYKDGGGVWTIGYGHTGNVTEGETITQEQADEYLRQDTSHASNYVDYETKSITINQNQHDALTSLVYNIGVGNFADSTLLKKLLKGDIQGAADQFLKWDNVNHQPSQGLLNRRKAERELFLTPTA